MFDLAQLTILYLLIGSLTGMTAGLLGVGGGLIVVPALVIVFSAHQIGGDHIMHLALGTSLATIIFTSIASIRAHHKHQAVDWNDVKKMAPGLVIGSFAGAFLADQLPTKALQIGFAIFVILIAVDMLFDAKSKWIKTSEKANKISPLAGGVIGIISALTGIGGGSMTVPYLSWNGRNIRRAIATSSACGLPIAIAATAGFVWTGISTTNNLSGYVYLPAFTGIVITSILMAPIGANLAHSLPVALIKRIFAVFLLLVGVKMLSSVWL